MIPSIEAQRIEEFVISGEALIVDESMTVPLLINPSYDSSFTVTGTYNRKQTIHRGVHSFWRSFFTRRITTASCSIVSSVNLCNRSPPERIERYRCQMYIQKSARSGLHSSFH